MIINEGEIEESPSSTRSTPGARATSESVVKPEIKLKAILEIARNLSSEPKIDAIAPKILDSLMELFPQAERLFLSCSRPRPSGWSARLSSTGPTEAYVVHSGRPEDEVPMSISRSIVNTCSARRRRCSARMRARTRPPDQRLDRRLEDPLGHVRAALDARQPGARIIQLDTSDRHQFNQDDLGVLAAVASQAAIAIQNAAMHESLLGTRARSRDLKLAEQVQKRFLPQSVPTIPGYEFFAHYDPAHEVGGDYFDFVPLPNNRLAVAVGEVSGRGVASALLMTQCSLTTRSCILEENAPAEAANELNRRLCSAGFEERFATLILGVLDLPNRTLSLISAGHLRFLSVARVARLTRSARTSWGSR